MADSKSVRLRNVNSGAVVQTNAEDVDALGSEWEPADEKKAPAKKSASSKSN